MTNANACTDPDNCRLCKALHLPGASTEGLYHAGIPLGDHADERARMRALAEKAANPELDHWQRTHALWELRAALSPPVVLGLLDDVERLSALCETLKREAQIQAQEMRTQRAIVRECYQAATGSTGEPGDWNGAKPVRELRARAEAAEQERDACRRSSESWWSTVVELTAALDAATTTAEKAVQKRDAAKRLLAESLAISRRGVEAMRSERARAERLEAIATMLDAVVQGAQDEFVRVPYGASHEDVAQINEWHAMAREARAELSAALTDPAPDAERAADKGA